MSWIDDLTFAQQTQVAVEISMLNGEQIFTGVDEVDVPDGTVSLWAPQVLGGEDTTRRRIRIDDIVSLTVTEIDYRRPGS